MICLILPSNRIKPVHSILNLALCIYRIICSLLQILANTALTRLWDDTDFFHCKMVNKSLLQFPSRGSFILKTISSRTWSSNGTFLGSLDHSISFLKPYPSLVDSSSSWVLFMFPWSFCLNNEVLDSTYQSHNQYLLSVNPLPCWVFTKEKNRN